jgi:hypothetical protein
MLSNFHRTTSECVPDRWTVVFAASVKTSPLVEQAVASAVQVATVVYAALLRVPLDPVALVQVAAFQLTSLADHVVAPPTGGVNDAALACRDTLSCFAADAVTIWSMVTVAALAVVLTPMLVTLNVIPDGTTTRACSLTVADTVVV